MSKLFDALCRVRRLERDDRVHRSRSQRSQTAKLQHQERFLAWNRETKPSPRSGDD